jgi:hypothetical protein
MGIRYKVSMSSTPFEWNRPTAAAIALFFFYQPNKTPFFFPKTTGHQESTRSGTSISVPETSLSRPAHKLATAMHPNILRLLALGAAILASALPLEDATAAPLEPRQVGGDHTMGFIGCSMAENVASGYVAVGGKRMWGPYGTGGLVVQSWTNTNSNPWKMFDQQVAKYGKPTEVWVQICIFQNPGVKYEEVVQIVANARQHAAPGATIYITGQPIYPDNPTSCFLAGSAGPQLTEDMAKRAGADMALNVTYPGPFVLMKGEVQDGCHANSAGQKSLGQQALKFFG